MKFADIYANGSWVELKFARFYETLQRNFGDVMTVAEI